MFNKLVCFVFFAPLEYLHELSTFLSVFFFLTFFSGKFQFFCTVDKN